MNTKTRKNDLPRLKGSAMQIHPTLTGIVDRLENGGPLRIVCFGDSITGIYFHTGSRIAYPELLGAALRRLYPASNVEVINAGIGGDHTRAALKRMERDVLDHQPHLVTVMFGMNDVKHADG